MYSKALKDDLHTSYGWANKKVTIKRGAYVTPADNLPEGGYWVVVGAHTDILDDRPNLTRYAPDDVRSWAKVYGFHVTEDQVIDEKDFRSDASLHALRLLENSTLDH